MNPQTPTPTPVLVIGTLGELSQGFSPAYLGRLVRLVQSHRPELLLAEIPLESFEQGDPAMPPEYSQGLLPLGRSSDTVVVPVGTPPTQALFTPRGGALLGLRRSLVRGINGLLVRLQGHSPAWMNGRAYGMVCDRLCHLTELLCGGSARREWAAQNSRLLTRVLSAIRRDPGRRVVVTLDCRRRHSLLRALRKQPELRLVTAFAADGGPDTRRHP
ncbi:hypothetical protein [uncultured Meiothermus sp.]|jgi:hypothetical protein|uniref:hypothetical protein n=1 Tax=uncultured Meiothermus sp. TaxID=157471 RepID=UPI00262F23DF|nr:hypothetical protein [uncultured Meiothermus sp.]